MHIEPIIRQIASEAKKGQNSTINLSIKLVYSRFNGFLSAAPTAAQSATAASQQTTQKPPNLIRETSKTSAKRGRSTTSNNMLIESRERDKLTLNVTIIPLIKR